MSDNLEEKTLTSEIAYKGNFLTVRKDTCTLPNGKVAGREFVVHPGAGAIVALTDDNCIILERQYRYALHKEFIEIPAGKRDAGEDGLACAKRELEEETGYVASEWTEIGPIATSFGFSDEVIYLYLAKGLKKGDVNPDEDEFVSIMKVPFDEAVSMIGRGEIVDAKSICAILKAKLFLGV